MIITAVEIDTQIADTEQLRRILADGQLLHAGGIINTRWQEYSAQEIAEAAGIENVCWDVVADDTPGMLELTIWYPRQSRQEIAMRLSQQKSIEHYDITE